MQTGIWDKRCGIVGYTSDEPQHRKHTGGKKIENFLMTENSPHQALGRMASFPLYIKAGDKQVISTDSGLQILSFGSDIPFV